MLKRLVPAALALCAFSALALAQGPAEPTGSSAPAEKKSDKKIVSAKEAPSEVQDDALDRERSMMDARFAARVGAIKADADRRQAYHTLVAKRRFDFERHSSEERKAFYLYLKSVSPDERPARLKEFDERQDKERLRFDKDQLSDAKTWFDDEIENRWKSESLLAQALPMNAQVATPASAEAQPAPKARKPAIAKKPKAQKRRRSRIEHDQASAPASDGGAASGSGAASGGAPTDDN